MIEILVMLEPVIKVVHILAAVIVVVSVLLQAGKGAGLGAAFGVGSSQTLFGAQGSGHFLSRITMAGAIVFLLTSMSLALVAKDQSLSQRGPSVIDEVKETTVAPAGEAPAEPASEETPKP